MANSWWVLIPQGDQGKPTSYLDQVDFRLQFGPGTPEYKALKARKPIQYGPGMNLVYWKGPFATEAEAEKAQNPKPSPNPKQAFDNAASSVLGLPQLHNLRDLMVRVMKVVIGGAMIIVGLVEIAKPGQILSKLPVPIPV